MDLRYAAGAGTKAVLLIFLILLFLAQAHPPLGVCRRACLLTRALHRACTNLPAPLRQARILYPHRRGLALLCCERPTGDRRLRLLRPHRNKPLGSIRWAASLGLIFPLTGPTISSAEPRQWQGRSLGDCLQLPHHRAAGHMPCLPSTGAPAPIGWRPPMLFARALSEHPAA